MTAFTGPAFDLRSQRLGDDRPELAAGRFSIQVAVVERAIVDRFAGRPFRDIDRSSPSTCRVGLALGEMWS